MQQAKKVLSTSRARISKLRIARTERAFKALFMRCQKVAETVDMFSSMGTGCQDAECQKVLKHMGAEEAALREFRVKGGELDGPTASSLREQCAAARCPVCPELADYQDAPCVHALETDAPLAVGVPECDGYITQARACLSEKIPEAMRPATRTGLCRRVRSWLDEEPPGNESGLAARCQQDALRDNAFFAQYGCEVDPAGERPQGPGAAPSADGAPARQADEVGVQECDRYIALSTACIESKVPEPNREAMRRGLQTMREAWRDAAETEAGRAGLSRACQMATEAARQSMSAFECDFNP